MPRRQVALRGMGHLVEFDIRGDAITATVENAIPPLLVAGMLQGIFELITRKGSVCCYERDSGGTLTFTAHTS